MELLRSVWARIWAEGFNQAYLWALGFLLFTAIMGTMGWSGTFGETAHVEGRRGARADASSPAGKKPVVPADWP